MNRTILMTLMIFLFLGGCKKDSNPISTDTTEPSFVIDTMKVGSIVKTDTSTGSPVTYISFRFACHFVGKPGSLDGISFSSSNLGCTVIFEPVSPTPVGLQIS